MKTINHAINGLVSSLLLNVGLTGLAEKLDPVIQQSGGVLKNLLNAKTSAFSDFPCNFKSSAFSDFPCNFKTSAFSDFPCNFTPQAAK
jgi:hypothetical protein